MIFKNVLKTLSTFFGYFLDNFDKNCVFFSVRAPLQNFYIVEPKDPL